MVDDTIQLLDGIGTARESTRCQQCAANTLVIAERVANGAEFAVEQCIANTCNTVYGQSERIERLLGVKVENLAGSHSCQEHTERRRREEIVIPQGVAPDAATYANHDVIRQGDGGDELLTGNVAHVFC